MKTEIIFTFDTEDFTTPRTADAVMALTGMLKEEHVTGHFAVVGLLAEQFLKWGRTDVLEALKPHVLGFHTYSHSIHPVLAERCDQEDCTAAAAEMEIMETKGLELLHQAFGDQPVLFAVPPGQDIAYPAIYFYARAGIPFYLGGLINDAENTLIDYCGMTQIPYSFTLEGAFFQPEPPDMDKMLDDWSTCRRVILNHHPNMLYKKVFWDALNYNQRNLCGFGHWREAPERTPEESAAFLQQYRMLIHRLREDGRFVITDLPHILEERREHAAGPITPAMLPVLAAELDRNWAPLKSAPYSVADVFHAAAAFLQGKDRYVPGIVKGFLRTPHGVETEVTVSADAVRQAAQQIRQAEFIPEQFSVGGLNIGPADMLFAMAAALNGENSIRLLPRPQIIDVSELRELSTLNLRGKWLFAPELQDRYLSDRLRLQAWTWRKYGF